MDYRERFAGDEEALRLAMLGGQTRMWTALPGIFQSFNLDGPGLITAVVQPSIMGVAQDKTGAFATQNLPVLQDVPVVFPHGGQCSLTFPLKPGDECLIVFSSRCIDAWWQLGGIQKPLEPRMHDLSDAFAIPGPYSVPKVIPNISTTAVQLRSDDGLAFIEINPTNHIIKSQTTTDIESHAGNDIIGTAGRDCTLNVGRDDITQITRNLQLAVGVNATATVGANASLTVGANASGIIHGTMTVAVDLAASITTLAGMTLSALGQILITAGQGLIATITGSGSISISGPTTLTTPVITASGNITGVGNVAAQSAATGSFSALSGQLITVQDGIITNIF